MDVLEIAGVKIGKGQPPFIIAEVSANHNGDIGRALELLEVAKKSGAQAVKLQTYRADTITIDCSKPDFLIPKGPWAGRRLYDLYDEAHTPWEWHGPLFERARELGLIAFSSPFDETAIDFLETFDVPAYKVASFELLDLPLVRSMARTMKPIIMSTGMANLKEIEDAVSAVRGEGNEQIILLHCVSSYPAKYEEANLKTIGALRDAFDCPIGLSDHTLGTSVSVAAVAMEASVIEKHFTLRRADGGADSAFSLEPDELKKLVEETGQAWSALGHASFEQTEGEKENSLFRRSLYVVEDIAKGDVISVQNVRSIRPGFGLSPDMFSKIEGKKVTEDLERGTALKMDYIEV
ncbi:pseudaminic acid synthase [Terasakiella sp. A23]|uniref:pseudaminic acid synthase n=1 Tax=Terasakiella sp. FCG-A23 TaxID=3080561 RepID=UPI002955AD80|nr:pseudaminic acid synthase [Terasakiella sp. A23]MDV7339042.1 pseudaminic acid synthase [Terasakiella sp. A23]